MKRVEPNIIETNYYTLVSANEGVGKTFWCKRQIAKVLRTTSDRIIVFDVTGEYADFVLDHDRIVPGRIRDPKEVAELEEKHGYADPLLDVGEVFGVWVIEGDPKLNDVLPFRKAGLEDRVFVTPDMSPYKKRKVRILNGAHTGFVLGALTLCVTACTTKPSWAT